MFALNVMLLAVFLGFGLWGAQKQRGLERDTEALEEMHEEEAE